MNNHSNNYSRGGPAKSYCKLCHDAGKTEAVYASHYIRDRLGKTTCPYLLSLTCRLCNGKGHTPKHCPGIKPTNSPVRDARPRLAVPEKPKKPQQTNKGFAALMDHDSSSEDETAMVCDCVDVPAAPAHAMDKPAPADAADGWCKYNGIDWNDIDSDEE